MYAIIEDGGKQYKVEQGQTVCVELRDLAEDQAEVEFDQVLYYSDDETTLVGQPILAGAKVVAQVNGQAAGPKLHPMQFRRRKDSQRRIGHRQKYLEVLITSITKPQ
ncbi:MAG: 50S ribosomal protein L21 [Sedimentisphaerales bacterium]|nr:50S ribosomal protein L21 [Sedimentisphaerales bacterium]